MMTKEQKSNVNEMREIQKQVQEAREARAQQAWEYINSPITNLMLDKHRISENIRYDHLLYSGLMNELRTRDRQKFKPLKLEKLTGFERATIGILLD